MRRHHARWLLPAMLALASATAAAEGAAAPTPLPQRPSADPLDAQAEVPTLVHRSSLATYRRFGDDEAVPWREANNRVARIGGWRAYAREAQAPEAPEGARPASKVDPAPALPSTSKPMPGPQGDREKQ